MRSIRSWLPTALYAPARSVYIAVTGRRSRRITEARLRRSARHPLTYYEKVRHKVAFDREPILTRMVDKVAVRDLVSDILGPEVLTTAYAVAADPGDIDWATLPREFACKVSHGCGGAILVWDGADPDARLPTDPRGHDWGRLQVRAEHVDLDALHRLLRHWLTLDYSWWPGKRTPEWAYQAVPPRILVEEFLCGPHGGLPMDYKLHVIDGRVRFVRAMSHRAAGHYTAVTYDRDWVVVPVDFVTGTETVPRTVPTPEPPPLAATLVRVAEALGALTDAVRVDMYSIGTRVVVGELTVYPNAGEGRYEPRQFDLDMGALWRQAY